jgi:hypothetical protein
MAATSSARADGEPVGWSRFDSDGHRAAQAACRHVIHCAVDGTTRRVVSQMLAYARSVGDSNLTVLTLAQLTGPCALPPTPTGVSDTAQP